MKQVYKCDYCDYISENSEDIREHEKDCSYKRPYKSVCPINWNDCICDPAYIKYYHPEWYKKLHGDKSPEEVVKETCCKKIIKLDEPLETYTCPSYDDEDK